MRPAPDLETKNLHYAYAGGIRALRGVDLRLTSGSFTALIGQNGSGKSTLARQFNGLLRPTQGRVLLGGEDIQGRSTAQLAHLVGFCFQNPDHQIFSPTTEEEIAFGPRNLDLNPLEIEDRVERELDRFQLRDVADRPPASLSYGQRRLVTLAAVFAMRTPVLILDEPTLGLDRRHTQLLVEALRARHAEGHTILLITHDRRLIAAQSPRTAVLHEGRLLAHGRTAEILADQALMERVGMEPPPIVRVIQRLQSLGHDVDAATPEGLCRALSERRKDVSA